MAAAAAQYYFRFRISWCPCLQKVEIYQQTKFRRHISIYGWDITTSGLEKQTSSTLEFGFDLDHIPVICILFCISLSNFVQIGTATTEIWRHIALSRWRPWRFRICWCHRLQNVKIYQQTKFRQNISIGGQDITTSVFERQTSAILEFYFGFRFRPFGRNLHILFCVNIPNFV